MNLIQIKNTFYRIILNYFDIMRTYFRIISKIKHEIARKKNLVFSEIFHF